MKRHLRIIIPLVAALLVTAIIGMGALRRLDRWTQDALFQHRGVTSRDIVIIGIDEEALEILGPYNTWDRNIVASALEALAVDPQKLPAAVAVDILYAGQSAPEADARLARAAEALGNVVTACVAEFGDQITWSGGRVAAMRAGAVVDLTQPYEALRQVTAQGHINAMTDSDGVLRHALLSIDADDQTVLSLAARTANLYLEATKKARFTLPPVNAGGHFYVPFTGMPGDYYDGVSIALLIDGAVPPDYWAGKIVLIGPCATALQDAYFTSIDKGAQMYGVEFQANVIQSLLDMNFKRELSDLPQLIALYILCAAAAFLFWRMKVAPGAALCLGLMGLGLSGCALLYRLGYVTHPLWLPVAALQLYLAALAGHYAIAVRERQALALEKERIGAELALATRIQENSLPKEFPPFPDRQEFDIFASMTPAKEVGGDLYDFFLIDDDHLALVIGDVSGKGVPAALFMMVARTLIHHVSIREMSPAQVLRIVNGEICSRNPEEMFVTVWLGVLEISTGRLAAANAGHEFPAMKEPEGDFELVKDKHGFVIGGMEGMRYREYTLQLRPGAKLFVYTDGVTEATNAREELFGIDRMLEALRRRQADAPEDVIDAVKGAVGEFVGSAPQFDDLTMLCLQYNGPGDAPQKA